jgi:hypothetical protein
MFGKVETPCESAVHPRSRHGVAKVYGTGHELPRASACTRCLGSCSTTSRAAVSGSCRGSRRRCAHRLGYGPSCASRTSMRDAIEVSPATTSRRRLVCNSPPRTTTLGWGDALGS